MENTNNQIILGLNIEQTMHLIQEQLNKIAEKVRG